MIALLGLLADGTYALYAYIVNLQNLWKMRL